MKKKAKKKAKKKKWSNLKRKFKEFVVALDMLNTQTDGKLANLILFAMCVLAFILICIVYIIVKAG